MSEQSKRFSYSSFFPQSKYETQVERLSIGDKPQKLFIGIPKETTLLEHRVALIPSAVAILVGNGHRVIIEADAGESSNFTDNEYSEAGAEIAHEKAAVYKAQILIKSEPPTIEETNLMQPDQVLISPLQIPLITAEYMQNILQKRVIAVAMEYLRDSDGTFPMVRIMSEMAGISAVITAGELLSNTYGQGILLGGISGVPPAKVIILGAGVVGEYASRAAIGLGATVRIFDNNIYKLMRIKQRLGQQNIYTSSLNPVYLKNEILDADVVIGAIHSETGKSPVVVSEDLVRQMKPGAVIIDVSIDQGGCIETSEVSTHDHPTFTKHDVIHYCVPNIASKVARTASIAISNILTSILLEAGETSSIEHLLSSNSGLRHGIYAYKGRVTNEYLARSFNYKYTNLELLMTTEI